MSAMKSYLMEKSEEVESIVSSFSKAHIAVATNTFIVAKAFHHMTVKYLVLKLQTAGFKVTAQPFRDGRYNVLINLNPSA